MRESQISNALLSSIEVKNGRSGGRHSLRATCKRQYRTGQAKTAKDNFSPFQKSDKYFCKTTKNLISFYSNHVSDS